MICVDLAGVGVEQPDKVLFADLDATVSRGDRVARVRNTEARALVREPATRAIDAVGAARGVE